MAAHPAQAGTSSYSADEIWAGFLDGAGVDLALPRGVTPELMRSSGLVRDARLAIKVLARGDVSKKLSVQAHKFSGKAAEKLAAAGGGAETLA